MIARYRGRVSGPLLDRIDLNVEVPAVSYVEIASQDGGESSSSIRPRIEAARALQAERNEKGVLNVRLPSGRLRTLCRLDARGRALMERAVTKLGLSARGHDRALKVARTIADLAGDELIRPEQLAEAIQYRGLNATG